MVTEQVKPEQIRKDDRILRKQGNQWGTVDLEPQPPVLTAINDESGATVDHVVVYGFITEHLIPFHFHAEDLVTREITGG